MSFLTLYDIYIVGLVFVVVHNYDSDTIGDGVVKLI